MTDILDEYCERFRNWGRWGDDDQRGTANFITPEMVRGAAALVRTGQVISLALPYDAGGPQTGGLGRFNPIHLMLRTGSDHALGVQRTGGQPRPRGFGGADDIVIMPLQSGTQWDALAHIHRHGKMYNGYESGLVTAAGATKNGIENHRASLVGRGVLLDVARFKGVDHLEPGYAITAEDLDATAAQQGVTVGEGDIVLVRTGDMGRCLRAGTWDGYAGGDAPGLSFYTAPWLYERRIAALATDTWGVEVRPNELPDSFQPLHLVAIVNMGLILGEIFALDELGEACAGDGVYEFMFAGPPLPFTGAVGSPLNPVAIR
jgi:kynurenine formamidase